jgi:hypothetical protein
LNIPSQLAFPRAALLICVGMQALLRALIPSWRFFDDVGPEAQLWYQSENSPWTPLLQSPTPRHWYQLFMNAEANLRLAIQSMVERLASEIGDIQDGHEQSIASSTTYLLAVNAVRAQLRGRRVPVPRFHFQIRLDNDIVFISDWHEVF